MALTLIQKLGLIESRNWVGLGYEFLEKTAKEAAAEIEGLHKIIEMNQPGYKREIVSSVDGL